MQDAFGVNKAMDPAKIARFMPKKEKALTTRLRLKQAERTRRASESMKNVTDKRPRGY